MQVQWNAPGPQRTLLVTSSAAVQLPKANLGMLIQQLPERK
jgi:hypothetical protein